MTISKKHFCLRRTSTRAINKKELHVDISKANLIPQYTSVENLYKTNPKNLPLGENYSRGLPDSNCINRFENAKKLAEVDIKYVYGIFVYLKLMDIKQFKKKKNSTGNRIGRGERRATSFNTHESCYFTSIKLRSICE